MDYGKYAPTFDISELWDILQDLIAMIKKPKDWPSFATKLDAIQTLHLCFLKFKISHIPRAQNGVVDSLARNARSFH